MQQHLRDYVWMALPSGAAERVPARMDEIGWMGHKPELHEFIGLLYQADDIAFLLRWLAHHSLYIFVVYRVALGVIVLLLAGMGTIS